jgi:hypothetical protein
VTIKIRGHPPFGAQLIFNGHEYVPVQAHKVGIGFTKQENCPALRRAANGDGVPEGVPGVGMQSKPTTF